MDQEVQPATGGLEVDRETHLPICASVWGSWRCEDPMLRQCLRPVTRDIHIAYMPIFPTNRFSSWLAIGRNKMMLLVLFTFAWVLSVCIDPCSQQCLCVLYMCCVLLYLEAWNCGSLASMKLTDSAIPNTWYFMETLVKIKMYNYAICYCMKPEGKWQSSHCVHISAIKSEQNLWHHCTLYWIRFLLSEHHFKAYLISVKANWSCAWLLPNICLCEMEAETVTGHMCNFSNTSNDSKLDAGYYA